MPPSPEDLDLGFAREVLVEDADGDAHHELEGEEGEGEKDECRTGVDEGEGGGVVWRFGGRCCRERV